jgi:hypothetical protein
LGVETIAKRAVKYSELHNYRGDDGWNNIKSGTIDIKHLKALNKKKFLSVKAKYVDFYFPRTFFVEKLSKMEDKDIYIDNQEQITATKENRIITI